MAQKSLIYPLTFRYDLDLQPTWTNVSNVQLCQSILESIQKCRRYGSDKLNLLPLYRLTFNCDIDIQPN